MNNSLTNELTHHGILGQKWGVRRYQNYDGSYTKRGLDRYNKSKKDYEYQTQRYKKIKSDFKSGNTSITGAKVTNARVAMTKAKRRMNNDYKRLKKDKLADEGKKLYSKGYTIRDQRMVTKALGAIGWTLLGAAKVINVTPQYRDMKINGKNLNLDKIVAITGATAMGAGATINALNVIRNRKLRAYYTHSSGSRKKGGSDDA